MKIRTFWQAVEEKERDFEPVSEEPSLTLQEGYESLDEMIPRIIRGEFRPFPVLFEYGSDIDEDEVLDSPVFDGLDDFTDIDVAKEIIASATSSAQADTSVVAEDSKHGAEEVISKHGAEEVKSEARASETKKSVSGS